MTHGEQLVNFMLSKKSDLQIDTNVISDGYHTFGELYEHRITLFIVLCDYIEAECRWEGRDLNKRPWKTRTHSDGSVWDGWFILGIGTKPGEQITYHLPESKWDLVEVQELDKAPDWDGHTSNDVLQRLQKLI